MYGDAVDASAVDAVNGKIAVADFFDFIGSGSISICTLASGGCSPNLTSPNMGLVGGVAINTAGDCWADALGSNGLAVLVYFAGCTGSGATRDRFYERVLRWHRHRQSWQSRNHQLTRPGLRAAEYRKRLFWLQSGVHAAQSRRPSRASSIYGHVGKQNSRYVTTDLDSGDVEVYRYKKTGLSFAYSFTGGLPCATESCEAAAYNPSSPK